MTEAIRLRPRITLQELKMEKLDLFAALRVRE
jgi:hypothetical protein